jgi:uncharacterized Tic20 family protein
MDIGKTIEYDSDGEENETLAAIAHLSSFVAMFVGPLVIMIVSEDEFVREHAKNALDWQISFLIYSVVSVILTIILIGIVGLIVFSIANIVFVIVGTIKSTEGDLWVYPISISLLGDNY